MFFPVQPIGKDCTAIPVTEQLSKISARPRDFMPLLTLHLTDQASDEEHQVLPFL